MTQPPVRTTVSFVAGFDGVMPLPDAAISAGLKHRFAIVQSTYRPDSVDMYFDENLWEKLIGFAQALDPSALISVIEEGNSHEINLNAFMSQWSSSTDPYPDPPPFVIVRDRRGIALLIATEYWTRVGGPPPYADSYTYSFYSRENIEQRAVSFLLDGDRERLWELVTPASLGRK
jgi:hypothetical protein